MKVSIAQMKQPSVLLCVGWRVHVIAVLGIFFPPPIYCGRLWGCSATRTMVIVKSLNRNRPAVGVGEGREAAATVGCKASMFGLLALVDGTVWSRKRTSLDGSILLDKSRAQ